MLDDQGVASRLPAFQHFLATYVYFRCVDNFSLSTLEAGTDGRRILLRQGAHGRCSSQLQLVDRGHAVGMLVGGLDDRTERGVRGHEEVLQRRAYARR